MKGFLSLILAGLSSSCISAHPAPHIHRTAPAAQVVTIAQTRRYPVRTPQRRVRKVVIGTRVTVRPAQSVVIHFNGLSFLFAGGVFYKECENNQYEVVKPEIGMTVPQLPEYNVEKVSFKNETLFLFDGTLYKQIPTPEGIQYKVTGFIE